MTKDRDAKYKAHYDNLMQMLPQHEIDQLPEKPADETYRQYMRRLRKLTYKNARTRETWQQLQRQK